MTAHTTVLNSNEKKYKSALVVLTSLFFMWGFITCLNDILIPHLKSVFELNYTESMLIQLTFFGAYFIMSIPSGWIIGKIGYQKGIVVGLIMTGLGALMFYPAAEIHFYPFFLLSFFILASGITVLQVAANPYVSALGDPETASGRLNLTQAFNSLGTTIAPLLGALLILSDSANGAESVKLPYIGIAVALFLIALYFAKVKLPKLSFDKVKVTSGSAWKYKHLVLGAIAIFVYVGAEVAIGSVMINYLGESHILALSESEAAKFVAVYWGGAMIGRFFGSIMLSELKDSSKNLFYALAIIIFAFLLGWYLTKEVQLGLVFLAFAIFNFAAFKIGKNKPTKTLSTFATIAAILVLISIFSAGYVSVWTIITVGLFNSIMFPTIFTLAIDGLGEHTSQGSGILCAAIVGGAIIPQLVGILADNFGLQYSLLLPVICYFYIVYYGLSGYKKIGEIN